MIAAFAFWFPFRYAGIFSMAPGAMMGVGAYSAAIALSRWDVNFWLQIPLGFAFAAFGALLMGAIALRTSASYFVILTLVLSQLYILIFANWESLTRGRLGIVTARGPGTLGPFDFETPDTFYYLVLAFLGATIAVLFALSRSQFGRRLITLRENEPLARSLGVPAYREKLAVFVLFGGLSGVAGVLLFHYLRFIEPGTFSVYLAINIQLIVLLGGVGVWVGPIVGAAFFALLPEVLSLDPVQANLAYGLILLAVIVLLPMGLAGMVRRLYVAARWRASERAVAGSAGAGGPASPPTAPLPPLAGVAAPAGEDPR